MYSIEVDNISKIYNLYNKPIDRLKEALNPFKKRYHQEYYALNNISFKIPRGQTIGVIGQNGSGKSTLLKIISGVITPSFGKFKVNGRITSLLELGTGFNPELTGIENVFFYGTINGLTDKEVSEKLDDILKFADIGKFIHQPVKTYSSGMFVRLAFACATQIDPDILIVDEALAVGDAYFVHKCMFRINEMRKKGATILLVTHDTATIKNICDTCIWLDNGRIKDIGDPIRIADDYLSHVFMQEIIEKHSTETINNSNSDVISGIESVIPNIDRRLGNQKCVILGTALYNIQGKKISATENNKEVMIRTTIQNRSKELQEYSIGYILRDSKGIDFASSNSYVNDIHFPKLNPNEICTLKMKLVLPLLHPGSYAFSVGISIMENGELIESDRIENCIVFTVSSKEKIYILMKLNDSYELEIN